MTVRVILRLRRLRYRANIGRVTEFAQGQYVRLYPTIASSRGGSVAADTRGVIRSIDPERTGGSIYLIEFLQAERPTGQRSWLRTTDLTPA
jgi:hypothetical protein